MFAQKEVTAFSDKINGFSKLVEKKFKLDKDSIYNIWIKESKVEKKKIEYKKCQHIMSKTSNKKGKPCELEVDPESKTGKYCKKHIKDEKDKKKKTDVISKILENKPELLCVKHKTLGVFYDKETQLVFNLEHKAYGKIVEEKVVALSEDDISLCKSKNIAYEFPETLKTNNESSIPEKSKNILSSDDDMSEPDEKDD